MTAGKAPSASASRGGSAPSSAIFLRRPRRRSPPSRRTRARPDRPRGESPARRRDQLPVQRATQGSEDPQIMDRLEEIRLPLAVVTRPARFPRWAAPSPRVSDCGTRERRCDERAVRDRPLRDRAGSDRHRPLNSAGRFSRNARIPCACRRWRRGGRSGSPRSRARPPVISRPRFTASMHIATATGPFARICLIIASAPRSAPRPGRPCSPARCATLRPRRSFRR